MMDDRKNKYLFVTCYFHCLDIILCILEPCKNVCCNLHSFNHCLINEITLGDWSMLKEAMAPWFTIVNCAYRQYFWCFVDLQFYMLMSIVKSDSKVAPWMFFKNWENCSLKFNLVFQYWWRMETRCKWSTLQVKPEFVTSWNLDEWLVHHLNSSSKLCSMEIRRNHSSEQWRVKVRIISFFLSARKCNQGELPFEALFESEVKVEHRIVREIRGFIILRHA